MPNTPYPIDPQLTAISVAYRNDMLIADKVLPRVPSGRQEFKWLSYPIAETMRVPDARVGRRGKVNEVVLTAEETISSTEDFGLDDVIPWTDSDQASGGGLPDPVGHATMQLTDYIMVGHEKRVADLVFDAAQYPSGFKVQLTSNDRWDVVHDDSNPIDDILTGMDAAVLKPTHAVLGASAWLSLRVHPKIVAAVHGNDGTTGIVTRQQVAALFELKEVLVGEGRLNTAAYGQAAVLGRVWGPHCLLFHQNRNADTRRGLSFGYCAEYGTRVAGQIQDPDVGLRGGVRVRVGESTKPLIVAALAAYLIEDVVS